MQVDDAWAFAQMEDFWTFHEPLTPWGKDWHDRRQVSSDAEVISKSLDDIGAALDFLRANGDDRVGQDRISYHLRRMPRLPLDEKAEYEQLELFQFKKFLANYRGLLARLPEPVCRRFCLSVCCQDLASELDRGGSDAETFYIADSYHPELGAIRRAIAETDAGLAAAAGRREAEAKSRHGLLFDGRDFLVVPHRLLPGPEDLARCYLVEPYDDHSSLLRLVPDATQIALSVERERLLEQEREVEQQVILRLSVLVRERLTELRLAVRAVTRWDLACAGARLALRFSMSRPVLLSDSPSFPELVQGAFIPCALECEQLGMHYEPVNLSLDAPATVLFGSNMGGKTVVLKSLLFFQLLAQAGQYVPALRFSTRLFRHIEYVGELSGERLAGLSGFGFEIWRFQRVWGLPGALIAFDELARTTGSHEAEALLSAIIEAYAGNRSADGPVAVFATHFSGVARVVGARYLRMRGLDRSTVGIDTGAAASDALAQRLAAINSHMRYQIETADQRVDAGSDALAIARMLGLDRALVAKAQDYFAQRQV